MNRCRQNTRFFGTPDGALIEDVSLDGRNSDLARLLTKQRPGLKNTTGRHSGRNILQTSASKTLHAIATKPGR